MPFSQPTCEHPIMPNAGANVAARTESLNGQKLFTNFKPGYSYMYLAYLGFLFLDPLLDTHGARLWPGTIAVLLIFVATFRTYVHTTSDTTRRIAILITFLLGICALPWNTGGSTFFVYAAGFLPFSFARVRDVLLLMLVEIAGACADRLLGASWYAVGLSCFLLLIVGGSNIFFAEQKRANSLLRRKQEENEALAAVAERERIARDLHDVLGHTLSVIVLKSELASRLLSSANGDEAQRARAAAEIADVERTARTALSEVREAIGGYRTRGLLAEIEAARRTLDAAGVILRADKMPDAGVRLSAPQETVLALSLREAVTNIVRHARATECVLHFSSDGEAHSLRIEDNGTASTAAAEGNGLRGMRERVESLGGRLRLEHTRGMQLAIELPDRP